MSVKRIVPTEAALPVRDLVDGLLAAGTLPPFGAEAKAFCAAFSERLRQRTDAKRFPDLQALAFWCRPASVQRMERGFRAIETDDTRLVPRGLAFHVAPSNVDTVHVYAWLLSLLAGNANVVRVSSRGSEGADALHAALAETMALDEAREVARRNAFVAYGHDKDVNAFLSRAADARLVWGGDATTEAFAAIPLRAGARDLLFGDRTGLAAVHARAFLDLPPAAQADLADRFFLDAFVYDQAACSSPRAVVFCGSEEDCEAAEPKLFGLVDQQARRRGWRADASLSMARLSFLHQAAATTEMRVTMRAATMLVARVPRLADLSRAHCGGGLFFTTRLRSLDELRAHLHEKDQTLTHAGFPREEVARFAQGLGGRGLERIVPMGQALAFDRYWEGLDLFAELTRRVHVPAGESAR